MAKEDRKSLRLWAEGARESVLEPHIPRYTDALERGNWTTERDTLQSICNEFHARISWRLKDHEEPDLPLPEYDATKVQTPETLSEEEEVQQKQRVSLLNERIRRWLKYRVRRLRKNLRTRVGSGKDPWTHLLAKLSGVTSPPKARQAFQQFMREEYESTIAPVVAAKWTNSVASGSNVQTKKNPDGPFRAKIARELFAELSEAERQGFKTRAKDAATAARGEYERALNEVPSQTAEEKQKCIDNVGAFLGPILQGIQERTGLHSTVILGGPIPKYGGELRSIYVCYGRNRTANPEHFPVWAKDRFTDFLEVMKEYLKTAFTEEEIAAAGLKDALAGAKYTIRSDASDDDDDDDDDSSSSDSSSDSDSETDSNADSEDSESPKAKKKRKAEKRAAKKAAKKKREEKKKAATRAKKATAALTAGKKRKRDADEGDASEGEGGDDGGGEKRKKKRNEKKRAKTAAEHADEGDASEGEGGDDGGGEKRKKKRGEKKRTKGPADAGAKRKRGGEPVVARKSRRLNGGEAPNGNGGEAPNGGDAPLDEDNAAGSTEPQPTSDGDAAATGPRDDPRPSPPQSTIALLTPPTTQSEAAASPPLPPLQFPTDAPDWLTRTVAWLTKENLGVHYHALLVALIALETKYGFDASNDGRLSNIKRPTQVASWITGGRGTRLKFPPSISNVRKYADEWQEWWDTLQPAWRERDDDGGWKQDAVATGDDVWDPLEAPGKNGCLSVVASLYFWGVCNKREDAELVQRWELAVLDVTWMLEQLCASID
ncbi:hypothetical protein DFH06DRAFT_1340640 [Mycena polygramma]|nr:hypothetical protein DFH06DRAFT_1340640 [Mycena polygramma]